MPMSTSIVPQHAVICAENIALLYLLHPVPAQPSRNPIPDHQNGQKGYRLSLQQERSLTGMLAFLSNHKDGPDHIPAVCVEEQPNSASLKVLIAVNKATPDDGNNVLKSLKTGFETLFAHLSKVSDNGNLEAEKRIFTAIISMCSARILCRLRLVSNSRNTPKQPLKDLLRTVIDWLEPQVSVYAEEPSEAALFVQKAKEIVKTLDAWSKHQTPVRLKEVVEDVYQLSQIGGTNALLDGMHNRIMNPTAKTNLVNIIEKVARYREAARFLYRTARKNPMTRQMRIVLVSMPQIAFPKVPVDQRTSNLSSMISRISVQEKKRWTIDQVCRLLGITEIEANSNFVDQTRRSLGQAKIHAEVQLLFKIKASKLPPRVICSSKDACYLCNAFLRIHGKVHTPRCHGRLYPGWRLPSFVYSKGVEQLLNHDLEDRIRSSFALMQARQQKTVYPNPNESTLLTVVFSASTIHEMILPVLTATEERKKEPRGPDRPEQEETPLVPQSSQGSPSQPENPKQDVPDAEKTSIISRQRDGTFYQTSISTSLDIEALTLDDKPLRRCRIREGHNICRAVMANEVSHMLTTGHLEIQIEYSVEKPSGSKSSELSYDVEHLGLDDAQIVLKQHEGEIINAETLDGELQLKTADLDCFYITARGHVVKIVLHPSSAMNATCGGHTAELRG